MSNTDLRKQYFLSEETLFLWVHVLDTKEQSVRDKKLLSALKPFAQNESTPLCKYIYFS